MKTVALKVGDFECCQEPTSITTVVGTCVAFAIYDRELKIGALSHYALPNRMQEKNEQDRGDGYFGDLAITELLRWFKSRGSQPANLEVKIVGGARSLDGVPNAIGRLNIEMARFLCKKFGIPILSESVGGEVGMRVKFNPIEGELLVSPLPKSASSSNAQPRTPKLHSVGQHSRVNGPIKVLIVDDSKVIQSLFKAILSQDDQFEIFGIAEHPLQAEELMKSGTPDVITLDMQMPEMDGLTYLEKYLTPRKIPVIMISGLGKKDSELAFNALEVGAIDFVDKPASDRIKEFGPIYKEKIIAATRVNPKHIGRRSMMGGGLTSQVEIDPKKVIVIGSSTGGTIALTHIFKSLPRNIPPIVVVQHIPRGFSKLLADRLNTMVGFEVKEADNEEKIAPGKVLIAPGNTQLKLKRRGNHVVTVISDDPPVNKHKPSVDFFFDSVPKALGADAIGVILTGMGKDGAQGLLKMKESGSRTIAQDEESCAIFGMPKEAIRLGAAEKVVSLDKMAYWMMDFVSVKSKKAS